MKWNGTVSQSGHRSIAYRFASENSTQAMSHHRKRFGHSNLSGCIDPVPHTSNGDDRPGAELRA